MMPTLNIPAVISDAFDVSRSEARRLISQGAVSIGGKRLNPNEINVCADCAIGQVLKAGKRRFVRLVK